MTKRDIMAAIIGAALALVVGGVLSPHDRSIIGTAQAQQDPLSERQRYLLLAVANAVASVAVDGERTAMTLNDTTDQVNALRDQLRSLEKRLTELENKR